MLLVTEPRKAALDEQGWASRHCLHLLANALEVWSDVGHRASLHQVNQLLQSTASGHDEYVLPGKVTYVKQHTCHCKACLTIDMHVQFHMHIDGLRIFS